MARTAIDGRAFSRRCLSFYILSFLLTSGFFLGRNAKDALFYSQAGASRLPWAFMLNALVVFWLGGRLAGLLDRLPLRRSLPWAWGTTAVCLVAFGAAFQSGADNGTAALLTCFAFFAFFELPYLALLGLFWSYGESSFTPLERDRVFPRATAASHVGTTAAGIAAIVWSHRVGAHGLIYAWAACLLVGLLLILAAWRVSPPEYIRHEALGEEPAASGGAQAVMKYRYARLFALITFLTFFVMSILDYALADTAKESAGRSSADLTLAFGYITALFGIVAFGLQVFLVPRLLRRLSVEKANMIAPTILTIGSGGLAVSYSFIGAGFARGCFLVNEFVFNQTLLPFIYGAVPKRDRSQVRTTIEGTVTNVALGAAGLFLLAPGLVPGFQARWLSIAALGLSAFMLVMSNALRAEYRDLRGLGSTPGDPIGRLRFLESLLEREGDAADLEVQRSVMSPSETEVVLTLGFVQRYRRTRLADAVLGLVDDRREEVRLAALDTIAELFHAEKGVSFEMFLERVRRGTAQNGVLRYRREDASTLKRIADVYVAAGRAGQLGHDFMHFVGNSDYPPSTQALALAYIVQKSGALGPIRHALEIVENARASAEVPRNLLAACAAGSLAYYDEDQFGQLRDWVFDESRPEELRVAALASIGEIGARNRAAARASLDVLLEALKVPMLAVDAEEHLLSVVAGDGVLLSRIREQWAEDTDEFRSLPSAFVGVAVRLPAALRLSSSAEADSLLLDMILSGEHQIRRQAIGVLEARFHQGACASSEELARKLVDARRTILERLCLCGRLRRLLVEQAGANEFADDALRFRIDELFGWICRLIWMERRDPRGKNDLALYAAMRDVQAADPFVRGTAVKALEVALQDDRTLYLAVAHLAEALDSRKSRAEQDGMLEALSAESGYPWLHETSDSLRVRVSQDPRDLWLSWALERWAGGQVSDPTTDAVRDLRPALEALRLQPAFAQVPRELLTALLLRGRFVTAQATDRLLLQGGGAQGILVHTGGSLTVLSRTGAASIEAPPTVWGDLESLANVPSSVGVRVGRTRQAEGYLLAPEQIRRWMRVFPTASNAVFRGLTSRIEELNAEEAAHSNREGALGRLLDQFGKLDARLAALLAGTADPSSKRGRLRRHLLQTLDRPALASTVGVHAQRLEQYYLVIDGDREVRVRRLDGHDCILTLKDRSTDGIIEVGVSVAEALFDSLASYRVGYLLGKTRYTFADTSVGTVTVDIYDDTSPFAGLAVAEWDDVNRPQAILQRPEFELAQDVSEAPAFENRNLALHGPPDSLLALGLGI